MQQKKINNILYVFDTTPYQITEDTNAEIIKVQEESYPGFVELNESLADKFVKYNYKVICVNQQEWMPYINQPDPVSPELAWSAESATVTIGADDNVFPTLSNPHNVEVTYSSSDTEKATINETTGEITLAAAGNTTISAVFAGDDTYEAQTVAYTLTVEEAVPETYTLTLAGTDIDQSQLVITDFSTSETISISDALNGVQITGGRIVKFTVPSGTEADYDFTNSGLAYNGEENFYWTGVNSDLTVTIDYTLPTYAEVEVTYDVQNTESEIELFCAGGGSPYEGTPTPPDAMFVDDNPETVVNSWRFDSTGDHTVKFVFHSGRISTGFMQNNQTAKSINLNGQVTQIGENAFNSIQEPPLTSITSWAATPPTLEGNGDNQFGNVPIYVPADYVTDYQTAWTTYAAQIQAMQS